MHFVKKTTASEAQRVAEEKRQAAKAKGFLQIRDEIFDKREKGELDEELLSLTGELLKRNPDVYTLWNIRREVITKLKENPEEGDEEHAARLAKMYDEELSLTKEALFKNPKSYGAWYHRFCTFKAHPKPDLQKELDLCEKALSFDCRNFHCWDHRRSVAQLAKLTDKDELAFSDKLVAQNPSNYSAWHYRGTLLPKVRPGDGGMAITDDCLEEELKKTEEVCCMNSEDQTAWTYCRWLTEVAGAKDVGPLKVIAARFLDPKCVQIVLNKAANRKTLATLLDLPSINAFSFSALSQFKIPPTSFQCAKIWLLSSSAGDDLPPTLHIGSGGGGGGTASMDAPYVDKQFLLEYYTTQGTCKTERSKTVLKELMDVCEKMLEDEDEKGNPWEHLALVRTRILVEGVHDGNVEELVRQFSKVRSLDPQRAKLYDDTMDRLRIRAALNRRLLADEVGAEKSMLDTLVEGIAGRVTLKDSGVSNLECMDFLSALMTELILQSNLLTDITQLNVFASLTHLVLDDNPIERIPTDFFLPKLEFISLARTHLSTPEDIFPLKRLPSLKRILVCETSLADREGVREQIGAHFGREMFIIFHWL